MCSTSARSPLRRAPLLLLLLLLLLVCCPCCAAASLLLVRPAINKPATAAKHSSQQCTLQGESSYMCGQSPSQMI
jgi:hypothetical protein